MKVVRVLLVGVLSCIVFLGSRAHAMPGAADEQIHDMGDTLLVQFERDTPAEERAAIVAQMKGVIVDRIAPLDVAVVRLMPSTRSTPPLPDAARTLAQHPHVVYAEPNVRFEIADDQVVQATGSTQIFIPISAGIPVWIPNDFYYGEQHYAWEQIDAPAGWNIARGSTNTVIAIVDTGIQLDHPDLRAKVVPGADFVGDRETASPNDGNGHGTHVAGLAAAVTNNSIGVAGTCPRCTLMPVRVLNDDGLGDLVAVAQGVVWAADHGAKIINLSLTGPEESATLNNALQYAWNKGVLPVCAAGNNNSNNPAVYPASNSLCFTVGATNRDDAKASFSNYGPWVTIAAPGEDMYSTWIGSSYTFQRGTSMAAPIVAGTAGILSGQGVRNSQLRQRLCNTADPIAGTGAYWTCGRLNVFRAVANR